MTTPTVEELSSVQKGLRIHIRVTDGELGRWQGAAQRQGLTLSAWLRRAANERAALEKVLSDMEHPMENSGLASENAPE
jgi:hypothetical protein